MSSVNKVILVGRLGTNPDLRYTPNGKAICTLSLATNHTFIDKDNAKQEKVNWHKVLAWGKQGEICKEHLSKGRQVYIEGRLQNRSYTDKEGVRRFAAEIISNTVVFLDRSSTTGYCAGTDGGEDPPISFSPSVTEGPDTSPEEDELPF
jgi:single-strand DNA-binding protein